MKPILPPNILDKMSEVDRKTLGKAGLTPEELAMKGEEKLERTLRKQCIAFCNRHGILVGTARDDVKSTYTVGWPDLTCIGVDRVCFVELKVGKHKLTPEQDAVIKRLKELNQMVVTVRSYKEFVDNAGWYLGIRSFHGG